MSSIILKEAICICDEECYVYKPSVLNHITPNNIVRLSYTIDCFDNMWSHDSPYVKVIQVLGKRILGEIMNLNRQVTNKYPLAIGERVWFTTVNIIEIYTGSFEKKDNIYNFRNGEILPCSGPLYTTTYDSSDSEESSASDTESDAESEEDESSED